MFPPDVSQRMPMHSVAPWALRLDAFRFPLARMTRWETDLSCGGAVVPCLAALEPVERVTALFLCCRNLVFSFVSRYALPLIMFWGCTDKASWNQCQCHVRYTSARPIGLDSPGNRGAATLSGVIRSVVGNIPHLPRHILRVWHIAPSHPEISDLRSSMRHVLETAICQHTIHNAVGSTSTESYCMVHSGFKIIG